LIAVRHTSVVCLVLTHSFVRTTLAAPTQPCGCKSTKEAAHEKTCTYAEAAHHAIKPGDSYNKR